MLSNGQIVMMQKNVDVLKSLGAEQFLISLSGLESSRVHPHSKSYVNDREIGKQCWLVMPTVEFMSITTNNDFLGDPCVKTQHLLGAHYWERVSDTQVIGHHQLRAAHQVYTGPDFKD